jgi:hypothetical protein
MKLTEEQILVKYERLIQELTCDCEQFYKEDICQDLRIKLLKQIRNSGDQLNSNTVYKFLVGRRNRFIRKECNGGVNWVPKNPKTIETVSIQGDVLLDNYFYSN